MEKEVYALIVSLDDTFNNKTMLIYPKRGQIVPRPGDVLFLRDERDNGNNYQVQTVRQQASLDRNGQLVIDGPIEIFVRREG